MSSTLRVSSSFLNGLKASFPERISPAGGARGLNSPWYIVAAVAFSASNRPEAVPQVFEHAMQDLKLNNSNRSEERLLAQRLREALFKSGLISGYPKAINSLRALHEVMPDDLRDKEIHRDPNAPLSQYEATGHQLWRSVYGEKAEDVQGLLDSIYPEIGWFSKTIGYGLIYGHTEILSALETSYALVASLIAGDTPQQIAWHLEGARREGGTLEDVQAVRQISIEVAKLSGIKWQHPVPEI